MTEEKRNRQCPHWSSFTSKCTKNVGGLYIPMDEHIADFCASSNFTKCKQYQANLDKKQPGRISCEQSQENRRNSHRVIQHQRVIFAARLRLSLNRDQVPGTTFNLKAKTLDISSGGMRLFTSTLLTEKSLIEFSFGRDFPSSLNHAMGQVQWCNIQIDEPGCQVGISFREGNTSHAMERYIKEILH